MIPAQVQRNAAGEQALPDSGAAGHHHQLPRLHALGHPVPPGPGVWQAKAVLRLEDFLQEIWSVDNRFRAVTPGVVDGLKDGVVVIGQPRFVGVFVREASCDSSSRANKCSQISSSLATGLIGVHEDDAPFEAQDVAQLISA